MTIRLPDDTTSPYSRLAALGLELPPVVAPLAAYVPALRTGNLVYTAGQLPIVAGKLLATGKVGAEVTIEQAQALAHQSALNTLAALHSIVDLNQVVQIVKVVGFIASAPGFTQQAEVLNGASKLLQEVFGEPGRHARSAIGVSDLPKNAPVEVELIAEVR